MSRSADILRFAIDKNLPLSQVIEYNGEILTLSDFIRYKLNENWTSQDLYQLYNEMQNLSSRFDSIDLLYGLYSAYDKFDNRDLENWNEFASSTGNETYLSTEDVQNLVIQRQDEFDILIADEKQLRNTVNVLSQFESLPASATTITSLQLTVLPRLDQNLVTDNIFPELFDQARLSKVIPFMVLKHNNILYYKIYLNNIIDTRLLDTKIIDINDKVVDIASNIDGTAIIFSMNLNTPSGIKNYIAQWLPEQRLIINKISQEDEKALLFNIKSSFIPNERINFEVNFNENKEENIKCTFSFDNVTIDHWAWLYEVIAGSQFTINESEQGEQSETIVNPVINKFITISESATPAALKDNWEFSYQIEAGTRVRFKFTNHEVKTATANTSHLQVEVMSAPNQFILDNFKKEIGKIFNLMLSLQELIKEDFNQLGLPSSSLIKSNLLSEGNRSHMLKSQRPDLFIDNYPRQCMKGQQPQMITESEIKAWEAKTFIHENKRYNTQVLNFATPNGPLYFVCDNPSYPFPGVRENKLANNNIYPVIPCCFTTDQIGDPNSTYSKHMRGEEKKVTRHGTTSSTTKLLAAGQVGEVDLTISAFFNRYIPNYRLKRIGLDPNNTLSYVIAIKLANGSITNDDIESTYEFIINRIDDNKDPIYLELLKQECYDLTLDEIRDDIINHRMPVSRYIRLYEVIFKVNIVIIDRYIKGKEEDIKFGYPNYKAIYIRQFNIKLPTIILLHNTIRDDYDMLIFTSDQSKISEVTTESKRNANLDIVDFALDAKYSARLLEDINKLQRSYALIPIKVNWPIKANDRCDGNSLFVWTNNPYSNDTILDNVLNRLDSYITENKIQLLGQVIDSYGKARGLVFDIGTIIFPPQAPQNLPQADIIIADNIDIWREIINSEPYTQGKDGIYWNTTYDTHGIYIPTNNKIDGLRTTHRTPPLLVNITSEASNNFTKLKRDQKFIEILLSWLIRVDVMKVSKVYKSSNEYDAKKLTASFVDRYLINNSSNINPYNFSRVPRTLPRFNTIEESLNAADKWRTNFLTSKGINCYNSKLYDRLIVYIRSIYNNLRSYLAILQPISFIPNYYENSNDFINQENTLILVGSNDFNSWLPLLKSPGSLNASKSLNNFNPIVYRNLDEVKPDYMLPYVLLYKVNENTERYIMVQNVNNGDLDRAINIAATWGCYHVNLGYNADKVIRDYNLGYVVYNFSAETSELLISVATDLFSNNHILETSSGIYAALLSLDEWSGKFE